jgi:hypothetical protein
VKKIIVDNELISYCGLYCGSCKNYLKEKCPGCRTSGKYQKCKMRPCCLKNNLTSCADCKDFKNVLECKKYTNKLWNFLEFVFRTKRSACIELIREKGYDEFAQYMAEKKLTVLKR